MKVTRPFQQNILADCMYHFHVVIWAMAQPPHPNPLTFRSFPGAGFYFMIQPIGILLEPFIIPRIPRFLGGARLWLWSFSVLTAMPFCFQYLAKDRMDSQRKLLSEWSLLYILSPLK